MKKTEYFKKMCSYSITVQTIDEIIEQRDIFLENNKERVAKIDSEDLRVDAVGNNHAICIIRLTYYLR
jgi:hypothetical protein